MKNAEISKILKGGQSYRSHSFLLKVLPKQDNEKGGVVTKKEKPAFIAGKKIFKTAVLRNKARRRAKAAFVPYVKSIKDSHLLFNLYEEILHTPLQGLAIEMRNILEKGGMLTK